MTVTTSTDLTSAAGDEPGPLAALGLAPYPWRAHQLARGHRILRAEDFITEQLTLLLGVTCSAAVRELVVRALIAGLPLRLQRRVLAGGPLRAVRMPGCLHPDLILVTVRNALHLAVENKLRWTNAQYPLIARLSTLVQSADPLAATFDLAAYRAEGWSRIGQLDVYRAFWPLFTPPGVTCSPTSTTWLLFTESATATPTSMFPWLHSRSAWHTSRYTAATELLAGEVQLGLPTVPGGLTGSEGRTLVTLLRMLAT